MVRAVIFDMGGVLLRTEDPEPRRKWERRLGLPEGGLAKAVFDNSVARRASVGQATTAEIWAEAARQLALNAETLAELEVDFWRGDVWDMSLLDFVRSLRPRCKTGLLSNAWPEMRALTSAYLNAETFDVIMFSGEEGVVKPGAEIYQRALVRLGVKPAEAVFVDDFVANVEGAQAVGMVGVQFVNAAQCREDILRLLAE